MATKHYCDRTGCGKEIQLTPKRVILSQNKSIDLCPECYKEMETLLETPPKPQI